MKTVVTKFPSGWWGVVCKINSGDWILFSTACKNKAEAIGQARYASEVLPSGRLYGKQFDYEQDLIKCKAEAEKNPCCENCRYCYTEYGMTECRKDHIDYDIDPDKQHCELWSFGY